MAAPILVTGGSGKTGGRVVEGLRAKGFQPRVASRHPKSSEGVRFNWLDSSTHGEALAGVQSVYLVAPTGVSNPENVMQPFIDKALAQGGERFVLLSASIFEENGPMMGKVHSFLKREAPSWVVLRPSWFMQNFSEQQHWPTIRDENCIYSATGDGRVPFIDADDIAAVAVESLVRDEVSNGDLVLTGPRLLSYDEVAEILANVLQRPIEHRRLTEEEMAQRFTSAGMPMDYAQALAAMDTAIAHGAEERVTDAVRMVTGREPNDFQAFAERHKSVWKNSVVDRRHL